MEDFGFEKKTLRKKFSQIRLQAKTPEKDNAIAERLLTVERLLNAETVLLYASFRSEVDTRNIAENLIHRDKKIAFPVCGEDGFMTFHIISNLSQLKKSEMGIPEPDISLPQPKIDENTVCVVPALALTVSGFRLGYGGGYYDRFLAKNPCVFTVALAYEESVTDSLPVSDFDVKINMIITNERKIYCNEQRTK